MTEPRMSFAERNFGAADLGDERRTRRLPKLVEQMIRHPGGTLPQKLPRPEDLEAFYRLCDAQDVTHEAVVGPHRQKTLQHLQGCEHFLLAIHDATELDYTNHTSLAEDLGQIGNGHHRGYLAQNTLVVDPLLGVVVGLANQVLHVRAQVSKAETQAQKRGRQSRESRLWLTGTAGLPARREVVDVCDRGADTFEFLEHETHSGRTFVIRSAHNRSICIGHEPDGARALLHDYARTLPALGHYELAVEQKVIVKKPKRQGKKRSWIRTKRIAQLSVATAPVFLNAPSSKNGEHGDDPLRLWIVRVWEANTPAGEEPLEWLLLTNHPVASIESALLIKTWYEWRWTIERTAQGDEDWLRHRELELPPCGSFATGDRHSEYPRTDVVGLTRHRPKPASSHTSGSRTDRRRIYRGAVTVASYQLASRLDPTRILPGLGPPRRTLRPKEQPSSRLAHPLARLGKTPAHGRWSTHRQISLPT